MNNCSFETGCAQRAQKDALENCLNTVLGDEMCCILWIYNFSFPAFSVPVSPNGFMGFGSSSKQYKFILKRWCVICVICLGIGKFRVLCLNGMHRSVALHEATTKIIHWYIKQSNCILSDIFFSQYKQYWSFFYSHTEVSSILIIVSSLGSLPYVVTVC